MPTYDPDPPRKWKRKVYDDTKLSSLPLREWCELETDRDMDKSVEQLVCEVHEETHADRDPLDNLANAQKRMTSMLARVAMSSQRVADRMLYLTYAMGLLTLLLLVFQIITWVKMK